MKMVRQGQNLSEFMAIDALMTEYILENPSRFAEWMARQDKMVKPSLRSASLSTDDIVLVLQTQNVLARRILESASLMGGL
jgi:hypothetical protein